MTVSKGTKIIAAIIAAILFILLLVAIILLATHGHDDETGKESCICRKVKNRGGPERTKLRRLSVGLWGFFFRRCF
jgi:hypothetical protein